MSNIFKSMRATEIFSNMLSIYFLVSYHIVGLRTCCALDGWVVVALEFWLLSGAIVTPRLLQLGCFPGVCCWATLSLAMGWYIV